VSFNEEVHGSFELRIKDFSNFNQSMKFIFAEFIPIINQ